MHVRSLVAFLAAVTALVLAGPAAAGYPGGNGKIAYESAVEGNFEIFVMNADGSGQTNVSDDPTPAGNNRDPVWSPDGTKIAFSRASEGHMNVYVMNADGSGQVNLTPGANDGQGHTGVQPTWSPDGSKIAYGDNAEIWVMDASGGGKVNLTGTPGEAESQPAWSPDGTKIAFIKNGDIWVMNAGGGAGQQLLAGTTRGEFRPDWSPDGTKIAYDRDGDIWVMNADGSGQTLLTGDLNEAGSEPAWSPDGTKIVFSSNSFDAPNGHDIFVMNADGTNVTRLATPVPASDNDPSWQPADTSAPVLSLPGDLTVEAVGPSGASVTYSASATDDGDPAPRVSCSPPSGTTFALGVTTVTCTATDAAGNQSTGSFTVRVVDTVPPALSLPADITVQATGPAGATVAYSASALDRVDSAPTVSCAPASGAVFPAGETTVTCTATDASGNSATGSFAVRVAAGDLTPPVLSLPADMTVEAMGHAGARVFYSVSASDDVDASPFVSCTPASGSIFPLWGSVVRCSASDAAGNVARGEFRVQLVDRTPPVISFGWSLSSFQTWEFTGVILVGGPSNGGLGLFPSYPASARDLVDPSPRLACDPPPDTRLPVGTTTVHCTATDAMGNSATASREIVVAGPQEALWTFTGTLNQLQLNSAIQSKLLRPLERARIAFEKGAMSRADQALAEFELELLKQSRKGLSAAAVATLAGGMAEIRTGTFPRLLAKIAEKLERVATLTRRFAQPMSPEFFAKLDSTISRLALEDRHGALAELRAAKRLFQLDRSKLALEAAGMLERDLEAAITSLSGPKDAR